jgi:D-beta-D-heptose 7-phosphate kinase/D-beta-D-heptose 1-phosphate adenosyltransferase
VLRVDREARHPLPPGPEKDRALHLAGRVGDFDAVLVADYAKGVCNPLLLASVLANAGEHGAAVLVDPARGADVRRYRGADALTPNRAEAGAVAGQPVSTAEQALAAGRLLLEQAGVPAVLVKLDRDGMALALAGGAERVYPARAREVCDVTGAGDVVLAVLGLCRAAGAGWEESARLAGVAAGLEVGRAGVAPVSRAELRAALRREAGPGKLVTLEQLPEQNPLAFLRPLP